MSFTIYTTQWKTKIHILKNKAGEVNAFLAGSKIKEADYTDATFDDVKNMEDQETAGHYLEHMGVEPIEAEITAEIPTPKAPKTDK
jgi:hypothetical protein